MVNNIKIGSPHRTDMTSSAEACIRAQPRHTANAVRSSLGEVLDLSTGGARIVARTTPRSPVDVEFYATNKSVTIRAHVAWCRHTGSGFETEIGLVFRTLARPQRETIDSLARGRIHRALL